MTAVASATLICLLCLSVTNKAYSFIPIYSGTKSVLRHTGFKKLVAADLFKRSCPLRKARYVTKLSAESRDSGYDRIEYYDENDSSLNTSRDSLGRVEELGIFPLGIVLNPGNVTPLTCTIKSSQ